MNAMDAMISDVDAMRDLINELNDFLNDININDYTPDKTLEMYTTLRDAVSEIIM